MGKRVRWLAIITVLIILIFSISCVPGGDEPEPEPEKNQNCWAVIIGIGVYQYVEAGEQNSLGALDIKTELLSYLDESHIMILTDSDATKASIKDAICGWLDGKEKEGDTVLLFFSGHGNTDVFSPYDSSPNSYQNHIRYSELDGWLDLLESKKIVVLLESCQSAGSFGELGEAGRVILSSSSSNEVSQGDTVINRYFFPYYVTQALKDPASADKNGDKKLSAEEIYSYVSPKVTDRAKKVDVTQHPQMYDGYDGDLVLFSYE